MQSRMQQNILEALRLGPFAVLDETSRQQLAEHTHLRPFNKGEFLYREGQEGTNAALLLAGLVQLTRSAARGRECMLHLVRPGHLLDAGVLFYEGGLPTSAVGLTGGQILWLEKPSLLAALHQQPELGLGITATFALRQRLFIHKLAGSQGRISASRRVAAWLLHRSKMEKSDSLDLGVSREVLARLMGLSRESLSRELSRLASQQLVHVERRRVTLLQKDALQRLADSV